MSISRVRLPDNTTHDIHDYRISGVDTSPISGSSNVVTSGGVFNSLQSKQNILEFDQEPISGSTNPVTSGGIKDALAEKQQVLVSGTNIKTINNQSIVGSGNVTIQAEDGVGFESVSSLQDGTIDITLTNGDVITIDLNHTHEGLLPEVSSSDNGKVMQVANGGWALMTPSGGGGGSSVSWGSESSGTVPLSVDGTSKTLVLSSALSSYELSSRKVTTLSASSTDTQYPSAKCVYDLIGDIETLLAAL